MSNHRRGAHLLEIGDKSLTKIALFCDQPFLLAGLQSILASEEDLAVSLSCTDLESFIERLPNDSHDVLLVETTPNIGAEAVSQLKLVAGGAPIVLWTETVSADFASMMISLGVRGILRKSLPVELHLKCLRKVAAGDFWLEKTLSDRLLLSERVKVTPRERQLIGLLVQGLKNKEIAYRLGITEGTAKVYLSWLFAKMGVQDRFELALFALKNLGPNLVAQAASRASSVVVMEGLAA